MICRLTSDRTAQPEVAGYRVGSDFIGRLNAIWGHRAADVFTALILVLVAITVTFGPSNKFQLYGGSFLIIFLAVATWLEMRRHDRSLCERCVGRMPLNPSEDARRHSRRFAVVHSVDRKRAALSYVGALTASNILIALPLPSPLGWVVLGAWVLMMLSMIYLLRAYVTHLRLQPWCPWCSNGGGGDDVTAPEPVRPEGVLA